MNNPPISAEEIAELQEASARPVPDEELEFHPVADIFPMMSDQEFADLKDDIAEHGLREPVWLHQDGRIIDGRNRYLACRRAGLPCEFRTYDGEDSGLAAFIVSLNLHRRHLSPSQYAMCAARKASYSHGGDRRSDQGANLRLERHSDVAEEFGVSERLVDHARKVSESPVSGLGEAVDSGKVAVSTAATIADAPEEEQREVISSDNEKAIVDKAKEIKQRKREERQRQQAQRQAAVAEQATQAESDGSIVVSDVLDFIASLEDGSVSLLATDPPYAVTENDWDTWDSEHDYWDFMYGWLSALRPKMAEEYTAFIFCDADASPDLQQVLRDTGWPVLRQAIWHRPNLAKKRSGSLTFLSAYEPFWHCGTRGLNLPEEWGEERFDVHKVVVPQSTHTHDPSYHPTQKPLELMRRLVRLGSYPGELVVDPFCGSGTTPVAADVERRSYRSCDSSEEYVQIARGRVAQQRQEVS